MRLISTAVLILVSVSFSDSAVQTDWSGGTGVPGPVTDWGNSYDVADQINDCGSSLCLDLYLLTSPVEHIVDNSISACSVNAADVDGDGDIDVLGGGATTVNGMVWFENTGGTGTLWTKHIVDNSFPCGVQAVSAADIDEDGDMDLLGNGDIGPGGSLLIWWENTDGTGTVWTRHTVENSFEHVSSVCAADIDEDGHIDVVGNDRYNNKVAWWENTDGTGTTWTVHIVTSSFNGASSVYAADVDGDGDTDILGSANSADDIAWWENTDGTGTTWTVHMVDSNFNGASSVYAADVDGDGDTDVLGSASSADDITWWENTDGTGTAWTEHTVEGNFNGAWAVLAADIDGDGDGDVIGAAFGQNDITWWENTDGTGTAWTVHTLDGDFDGAISVYVADVDGDGDTDVLGGAVGNSGHTIKWWDVVDYPASGTLESSILDAGTVEGWEFFASNKQEPAGTSVGFQFRSSSDSASMGAWSDTVFTTATGLSGILTDSTQFMQYRVILQTAEFAGTPVLSDVMVSFSTYVNIGDSNAGEVAGWGLAPAANPSFGNFAVQVSVPQTEMVNLVLHDISGRVVTSYSRELPGGTHSVSFNNLSEGVYFCTVYGGNFTATERVVVLK
jgi:stress-induced morphogen